MASGSRKRDLEPPVESSGSRTKSPRLDSSVGSSRLYKNEPTTGIVKRVCLKNFMSHSNFEIKFNDRINFIGGRNGSGKSAILTALVIGLGGKAACTQRGTSLKDFIKRGKKSPSIEIELSNNGIFKYKPDIYGETVRVVRKLQESGTHSYQLLTSAGHPVSSKHDDLVQMLMTMNIRIDNPLAVLNQEMARTFLASNDPKMLFTFFVKATQLEDIEKHYRSCESSLQTTVVSLEEEEKIAVDIQKKFEKYENMYQFYRGISTRRQRILTLQEELLWAKVAVVEKDLVTDIKTHEQEMKKVNQVNAQIEFHRQRIEKLEQHKSAKIGESNDIIDIHKENQEILQSKRREQNTVKDEISILDIDCKRAQQDLKLKQRNLQILQKEIDDVQKMEHTNFEEQRKEHQAKVEKNNKRVCRLMNMQQSQSQDCNQIKSSISKLEQEIGELRTKHSQISRKIDEIKIKLGNLKKGNNNLFVYGEWILNLEKEIDQAHTKGHFIKRPKGPIGLCVAKEQYCVTLRDIFLEASFAL